MSLEIAPFLLSLPIRSMALRSFLIRSYLKLKSAPIFEDSTYSEPESGEIQDGSRAGHLLDLYGEEFDSHNLGENKN
jgi:hypothetical protein